jgi:hypothetical protein
MCGTAGREKAYGISASNYKYLGKANPYMNGTVGKKNDRKMSVSSSDLSQTERLLAPSNIKRVQHVHGVCPYLGRS